MGHDMCGVCNASPCECSGAREGDGTFDRLGDLEMTLTPALVVRSVNQAATRVNETATRHVMRDSPFGDALAQALVNNRREKRHTLEISPLGAMHAMVERFHREILDFPLPPNPTMITGERRQHCLDHLREEVDEFEDAGDIDGQADALLDLIYVALGRLFEMGVAGPAMFEEVHMANMRRVRGSNVKRPNSMGFDAVKPEGWTPPNLAPFLQITREQVLDAVGRATLESGVQVDFERPKPLTGPDEDMSLRRVPRQVKPARARPKILVLGHARHGKDTACEHLRDAHGLRFTSSSRFCAETVILPHMRDRYSDAEQCFHDRANHRAEWYRLINEFNTPDPSRLGRTIFADNDVYCGLRHRTEFHALKFRRAFDYVIWIDAADRCPPEPETSISVEPWMADFVVNNNDGVEGMRIQLDAIMERIEEE